MKTINHPNLPNAFLSEARGELAGKPVVITGATGFIGRRLVAALVDLGADVRVLLRSGHGAKSMKRQGASPLIGSLHDESFVERALQGQEVLFHLAYDVRASGKENLEVFSKLNERAQNSGLERIVHLSSMVVYDTWPDGKIDESASTTRTNLSDYRDAKIVMEGALIAGAKPVAILQPGIVHGPGSALWTEAPREALRHGPVILPDPVGVCPAIHVDDVVQGILRAGLVGDLQRERFVLNGSSAVDWAEFFQAHIEAIGQGSVERRPFAELERQLVPSTADVQAQGGPSMAARVSAMLRQILGRELFESGVKAARRFMGQSGPNYPDRNTLALYSARAEISDQHARDRLGYTPICGLHD